MNVCVINEIRKLNNYLEKRSKNDKEFFNTNIWYTSFNIGDNGFYIDDEITYSNSFVLLHELLHMSSYDRDNNIDGFTDKYGNGIGLTEGMTEYLVMKINYLDTPTTYYLETFVTEVIMGITDIESEYFRADKKGLLKKIEIKHLMDELDIFYRYHILVDDFDTDIYNALVNNILTETLVISSNNGCINLYNETKERYEKKKSFFIKNKVKMLREG